MFLCCGFLYDFGSGICTTPSVADRYNELPEEVRNAVAEKVSPEAKNLLRMVSVTSDLT